MFYLLVTFISILRKLVKIGKRLTEIHNCQVKMSISSFIIESASLEGNSLKYVILI